MITSFRDLEVWQKAMTLAEDVYEASRAFPRDELFQLTAQLRRAAVSVASNIAEGHGRTGKQEFLHFLSISHGSLRELETQIELAERLAYLHHDRASSLLRQCDSISMMLRALMKRLRES